MCLIKSTTRLLPNKKDHTLVKSLDKQGKTQGQRNIGHVEIIVQANSTEAAKSSMNLAAEEGEVPVTPLVVIPCN
jgi:hypothetical protein